jgi:hypothetical protein
LTTATGVVSVAAATAPSVGQVLMATSGTVATWQTPSTTNLASPGPIGNTTPSTGAFTTLSATGTITQTVASGVPRLDQVATTGTNAAFHSFTNTGGQYWVGVENSSGSYLGGSSAYALVLYAPASKNIELNSVGTVTLASIKNSSIALQGATPQAGTGITFPATQSASSDANTLDDYEEGTWTPTVGGTATYSIQNGTYVKIGQLVTVWADVQIGSIGSGNTTQIQGLPFTSRSAAPAPVMGAALGYFAGVATSVVTIVPRMDGGSTTMVLGSLTAASTGVGSSALWADSARIIVTFTYRTTA